MYAAQQPGFRTHSARVDGKLLVTPVGGCPDVACLKCGTREGIFPVIQDFEWLPTWAKVVTFFLRGGLARMIRDAAMIRVAMTVPLCDACHKVWEGTKKLEWMIPIGAFVALFAIAFGFAKLGNAIEVPILGLVGFVIGILALFSAIPLQTMFVFSKRVVPERIKDGHTWFEHVHMRALEAFSSGR
jgi:hypothetical protein